MDVKVCPSAVDMIVSFEIIVGGKFKISIYQDSIKDLWELGKNKPLKRM